MTGFEIMLSVTDDEQTGEPIEMSYSNSIAFEETPTEETIRSTLFGVFSELYAKAASDYGLFEQREIIFEDDEENEDSSDTSR